ncbi:hypothetical protein L21SP2_2592 [Salinispira pacifica]|uniref:Uncharacterized protein n=1 Tax=Salinispira pacifica TaxID=1307761 RepID=V5WK27_9SPIO|nr:hypothetical protein L21SP2_2592 [Salinispira pacifica]
MGAFPHLQQRSQTVSMSRLAMQLCSLLRIAVALLSAISGT